MCSLGECYYHGWGTAVNKTLARQYLENAASKGSTYAKQLLNELTF